MLPRLSDAVSRSRNYVDPLVPPGGWCADTQKLNASIPNDVYANKSRTACSDCVDCDDGSVCGEEGSGGGGGGGGGSAGGTGGVDGGRPLVGHPFGNRTLTKLA